MKSHHALYLFGIFGTALTVASGITHWQAGNLPRVGTNFIAGAFCLYSCIRSGRSLKRFDLSIGEALQQALATCKLIGEGFFLRLKVLHLRLQNRILRNKLAALDKQWERDANKRQQTDNDGGWFDRANHSSSQQDVDAKDKPSQEAAK